MEQLDITETAAGEILLAVCCRDPPTRRADLIALLDGGPAPLGSFTIER